MAPKTAKGLGRGLDALLANASAGSETVTTLPLQKVEPNPAQPRKLFDEEELQRLADSIARHGVIQPLTVRKLENGYYQIIAGERRWRAARMAGLYEVPVTVMDADEQTVLELALIENLQRQDLNPMEEAMGYRQLMNEFGMTQEQIARQVDKSRSAVANALRLLNLPPAVCQMITAGSISAGHARALLSLKTPSEQERAAQKVAALQLSVRQTELMCRSLLRKQDRPVPEAPAVPEVDYVAECEKILSRHLNRGVKITRGKRKGRLELDFYGDDDLQVLYEALQKLKF